MRSRTLGGTHNPRYFGTQPSGCDIDIIKGDIGQGLGSVWTAIGGAVAAATVWIGDHAEEIWEWAQEHIDIGPSYNPENGGELARQFGTDGGTGWLGQPWCNAYMDWLKKYRPKVWSGEHDVWTAGDAAPTPWRTIYDGYLAAGLPPGALLDESMIPVGYAKVQEAVQAAQAVVQAETDAGGGPPSMGVMQQMNLLALALAGANGPQAQAAAEVRVETLTGHWKAYVRRIAANWRRGGNDDGDNNGGGGGMQAGFSGAMPLMLGAAALLFFVNKK